MDNNHPNEEDKNAFIIRSIERYTFLFNKQCKDFKNNVKKQQAWREIAESYEKNLEKS